MTPHYNTHDLPGYDVRLEDWERALACLSPELRGKLCARALASARTRNKRASRARRAHEYACSYAGMQARAKRELACG